MITVIVALAPAMPLTGKLLISFSMLVGTSILIVSGRRWNLAAGLAAASISVATVIALEFTFPNDPSPGLDRTGALAALIGIAAAGVSTPWLVRKPR